MKKRNPFYLILGCLAVLSAFYPVQAQTPGLTYPVPLDEEHFPDAVFRENVSDYDWNSDGFLSVEECGNINEFYVLSGLTSLEGIRYFYALTTLYCWRNQLTSLDLSGLTALTELDCSDNQLTSLNLSGLTALTTLYCSDNQLTSLDLSNCNALTRLVCSSNQLTSLDLSGLTALTELDCSDNQLTSLNLSSLTALTTLNCSDNQLNSLDVSGCTALTILNCSDNQLATLDAIHLTETTYYYGLVISPQHVTIHLDDSDSNLFVFNKFIQDQGGNIENVTLLNDELTPNKPIPLALYDTVSYLYSIACNVDRAELPDTNFTANMEVHLTASDYNDYVVAEINDTHFPDFNFRIFLLNNIDTNHNRKLDFSEAYNPEKTNHLSIANQGIKDLTGIAYFPGIGRLDCSGNDITKLDLSGLRYLTALDCSKNPNLSVLEINDNKQLEELNCSGTTLDADFSQYPNLQSLACTDMELDTINLSGNPLLQSLDCGYNHLAAIDLSKNVSLQEIKADNNYHEVGLDDNRNVYISLIPGLDPNRMDNIQGGRVEGNSLHLDADTLTYYYYYMCPNPNASLGGYFHIVAKTNPEPVCIPINEKLFPDPAFRDYLKLADMNQDGQLNEDEIAGVTGIDVSGLGIQDLRGIGYFTELESLDCSDNQLTSVDLSANTKLETLKVDSNRFLVSVDENQNFDLSSLPGFDPAKASDWIGGNINGNILTFTEEEVSYRYETGYQGSATLPEVRFALVAELSEENLLPIDETHFPDPAFRDYLKLADMNQDGQLNEDEIAGVTGIDVSGLGIQDLRGIGYFTELESLDCSDNQLTSLDLSANTKLETLKAEGNRLDITLNDRNGFDLSTLPGFDPAKASDWEGCTRIGNLLTFTQQEVTYAYATGYAGSLAGTGLESVRFHLLADRDPSTSNENGLPTQGRVYVQDRVIHTQDIPGEISIFTPTGTLLYRGTGNRIPVGHSGVYIVRNREQVWKVFVL